MRRPLALIAPLATALVVALAVLVGPVAPAQAASYNGYESAAHATTNDKRADHGLKRLDKSSCLQEFARDWAEHMARTGEFEHQDLGPILKRCKLSTVGENIAYGYASGRDVVRAWMKSPGHRANILKPDYRLMGMGAAKDKQGRWWVSQVFGRKA